MKRSIHRPLSVVYAGQNREFSGSINMAIGRRNSWRTMFLLVMVFFIYIISNLSDQSDTDTILPGQSVRSNQSIVSRGGVFKLGLFSPGSSGRFHIGISYKSISDKDLVWVGNGDKAVLSSDRDAAIIILTEEGDLQLQVNGQIIWNTNTTTTDVNTTKAVLLDSGNLVVGSDSSPNTWESFNYPSATWLPGAKIGLDPATTGRTDPIILTAWNSANDPSSGICSFGVDQSGSSELLIWNKTDTIWTIGASNFSKMSLESKILMSITFNVSRTNGVNYATYVPVNDSTLMKMVLHPDGQLRQYIWDEKSGRSVNVWTRPNVCDDGETCGSNGICSMNQNPVCSCPKGFQFQPNNDYGSYSELHDYSTGCAPRNNGSQCLKDKDEFIVLNNIKRRPKNYQYVSIGSAECQFACANNCSCSAYSYTSGCYLWYGDLLDMEQQNEYDTTAGETIFLRSGLKKGENAYCVLVALV